MKLVRRGWIVVGIGVLAFFLGSLFGARALDAVVVPAIAVLAIAIVQVKLTDRPEVDRTVPEPGFPGEKRTIRIRIDTSSLVSITDQLGSGLRPRTIERTVAGDGTVKYEVELDQRGVHDIGPLSVTVRDSLGLVATQYRYSGSEPLLVYPSVRRLTSPEPLAGMIETEELIEREAFDQLREYVPGDSLRDIHWNTSAKRQGDLFVVEYTHENSEGISIAAEATADQSGTSIDAMATATASVITYLLDQGAEVSLAVPNGTLDQSNNEHQHREALALLARTRPGRVSTERVESADVYILGERGQATIEIDGQLIPFDQLTGGIADDDNRISV
jgi:uncharacterized protein (DUF58 family)